MSWASPGPRAVGKSTLVAALVAEARAGGRTPSPCWPSIPPAPSPAAPSSATASACSSTPATATSSSARWPRAATSAAWPATTAEAAAALWRPAASASSSSRPWAPGQSEVEVAAIADTTVVRPGARDGRRGPGPQGRPARGGRPRRRQQGRPTRRRPCGRRPARACSTAGRCLSRRGARAETRTTTRAQAARGAAWPRAHRTGCRGAARGPRPASERLARSMEPDAQAVRWPARGAGHRHRHRSAPGESAPHPRSAAPTPRPSLAGRGGPRARPLRGRRSPAGPLAREASAGLSPDRHADRGTSAATRWRSIAAMPRVETRSLAVLVVDRGRDARSPRPWSPGCSRRPRRRPGRVDRLPRGRRHHLVRGRHARRHPVRGRRRSCSTTSSSPSRVARSPSTTLASSLNALLLLFVGIVVGELAALQRSRAADALTREREARALFHLSRVLATEGLDDGRPRPDRRHPAGRDPRRARLDQPRRRTTPASAWPRTPARDRHPRAVVRQPAGWLRRRMGRRAGSASIARVRGPDRPGTATPSASAWSRPSTPSAPSGASATVGWVSRTGPRRGCWPPQPTRSAWPWRTIGWRPSHRPPRWRARATR